MATEIRCDGREGQAQTRDDGGLQCCRVGRQCGISVAHGKSGLSVPIASSHVGRDAPRHPTK